MENKLNSYKAVERVHVITPEIFGDVVRAEDYDALISVLEDKDREIAAANARIDAMCAKAMNLTERAETAEQMLATPVRLPERYFVDCGVGPDPNGDWLYYSEVVDTLCEHGLTVKADS